MSRAADKITNKIINYLGETAPENKFQKAVLALGLRAAIKYLHYQSMKGIYEVKKEN
jgi:hypothetical protein